ncbi:MAG: hypothetical protein LBU87_04180 [Lactobacillales bacterium]|jgi:hypothetical protein|nr:hypothetical protein [Lactobacillales bacterium]
MDKKQYASFEVTTNAGHKVQYGDLGTRLSVDIDGQEPEALPDDIHMGKKAKGTLIRYSNDIIIEGVEVDAADMNKPDFLTKIHATPNRPATAFKADFTKVTVNPGAYAFEFREDGKVIALLVFSKMVHTDKLPKQEIGDTPERAEKRSFVYADPRTYAKEDFRFALITDKTEATQAGTLVFVRDDANKEPAKKGFLGIKRALAVSEKLAGGDLPAQKPIIDEAPKPNPVPGVEQDKPWRPLNLLKIWRLPKLLKPAALKKTVGQMMDWGSGNNIPYESSISVPESFLKPGDVRAHLQNLDQTSSATPEVTVNRKEKKSRLRSFLEKKRTNAADLYATQSPTVAPLLRHEKKDYAVKR